MKKSGTVLDAVPDFCLRCLRLRKGSTTCFKVAERLDTLAAVHDSVEASAENMELAWNMDDAFMQRLAAPGAREKTGHYRTRTGLRHAYGSQLREKLQTTIVGF